MKMKSYSIEPIGSDMFFSSKYQKANPDRFNDTLENMFIEIHSKEYITNGLMSARRWHSEHILKYFDLTDLQEYLIISEELRNTIVEQLLIDKKNFIPIAYGWDKDPLVEVVTLPKFYIFSPDDVFISDFMSVKESEDVPRKIIVTETLLNIILSFPDKQGLFRFEEFKES